MLISTERCEFLNIPMPLVSLINCYLVIKDINMLASTCRILHQFLYIDTQTYVNTKLGNNRCQSNPLYWSINIPNHRNIWGIKKTLKMVKFIFFTKDEGRQNFNEATSCIEADFFNEQQKLLKISQNQIVDINRYPLIWNYQTLSYEIKVFYFSNVNIIKNLNQINIYLRSKNSNWTISCKKAQIKLYYSHDEFEINQCQLKEKIVMNKKKSLITY